MQKATMGVKTAVRRAAPCGAARKRKKFSPAFFKRRRDPRAAPLDAPRRARNLLMAFLFESFFFAPVSAKKKRIMDDAIFYGYVMQIEICIQKICIIYNGNRDDRRSSLFEYF